MLDLDVDLDPVGDDRFDDRTGELGRDRVRFGVGDVPLQDRARWALAEVGLEDRRQRQASAGAKRTDPVSCRHRPRAR